MFALLGFDTQEGLVYDQVESDEQLQ